MHVESIAAHGFLCMLKDTLETLTFKKTNPASRDEPGEGRREKKKKTKKKKKNKKKKKKLEKKKDKQKQVARNENQSY